MRTFDNYIIDHNHPPQFIGFVVNYPKSKRYVNSEKLQTLLKFEKKNSQFVAVLVNPNYETLEEIKNLPFDYYQLYDCSPAKVKSIKEKYKKKIITAITIKDKDDIEESIVKENESTPDIITDDNIHELKSER